MNCFLLTDVFIFSTYKLQFLKNSYVVFCEQEWALKQGQVIFLKQIEAIAPSPSLCQAWVWLSLSFVILAYPSPSFFSGCPVIAQWFGFFLKAECNVSVDLSEADLDLSWNTLWVVPCKKKWWRLKCWRQMVMDCCLFSAAGLWLGWLLPRWCASCPQAYSDGSNGVDCIWTDDGKNGLEILTDLH